MVLAAVFDSPNGCYYEHYYHDFISFFFFSHRAPLLLQGCIDLRKNALTFDEFDIPFLQEHELPEKQRMIELHGGADDETPAEARIAGPVANANASNYGETSQSSAATSSSNKGYSESDIATLTNLGVSRQEAIHALDMAGGNCEVAASLLFQN